MQQPAGSLSQRNITSATLQTLYQQSGGHGGEVRRWGIYRQKRKRRWQSHCPPGGLRPLWCSVSQGCCSAQRSPRRRWRWGLKSSVLGWFVREGGGGGRVLTDKRLLDKRSPWQWPGNASAPSPLWGQRSEGSQQWWSTDTASEPVPPLGNSGTASPHTSTQVCIAYCFIYGSFRAYRSMRPIHQRKVLLNLFVLTSIITIKKFKLKIKFHLHSSHIHY